MEKGGGILKTFATISKKHLFGKNKIIIKNKVHIFNWWNLLVVLAVGQKKIAHG